MAKYTNTKNGYVLTLEVTTKSQNQSTNKSVLNWSLKITNPYNHYFIARIIANVKIDGATVWSRAASAGDFNSIGVNRTVTVASGTRTVTHDKNGNKSVAASAAFRTADQGYSWSVPNATPSGTYKVPRIDQLPNAPSPAPTASQDQTTRRITVKSATAGANGGKITSYRIRRRNNSSGKWSSWITVTADSNRVISFIAAHFNTTYQFESSARTARGWGPWSATRSLKTMASGPAVRDNGTWKQTIAYVKHEGEWKIALVYVKQNGTWQVAGG